MKIGVSGVFHNMLDGVRAGEVVEVDDDNGARYCALGYAEPVAERQRAEHAEVPKGEERAEAPAPKPPAKKAAPPKA
jgi:hypothetical protein